ncbi:TDP-N-acetylfucosamine:lipid II N-acetylfucosaminyltransferase [Pseudomonas sp. BN411]|uniref:TDP-N-acetylfucosamine:lipid II N-acetylfucosaminyltransferase n=1 Tax=Pseudomonas sp. BN411 TaxID=2567887 RepID=UPI0024575224|nr:TDP-N-acetylfucosamine:lipid II N-acetylfucosaminyltransferase [Pseudomonas sp. BN411]MDH4562760.1 hypothetical protein [Pseudomonas sp. BN411]
MKILHIANPEKFTNPFFDLVEKEFEHAQHLILSHASVNEWPEKRKIKNKNSYGISWFFDFVRAAHCADKIVLHGLWDFYAIVLLSLQPWLLSKCYWVIWGGDLYDYKSANRNWKWKLRNFFKGYLIKRIGNLVTYVKGDVDLARDWYGAMGKYCECIMYPSNIYREYVVRSELRSTINIQIGNSADSTNNHVEILERLIPFRDKDIAIYAPLSYGDLDYAASVARVGKEWFGEKFVPLTNFMSVDQYRCFLGKIDIAIFNHKRQQAMGNVITLLGMGKKVYLRSNVTSWDVFRSAGVKVYDVEFLDLELLARDVKEKNSSIIKSEFSEQKVVEQLKGIFGAEN